MKWRNFPFSLYLKAIWLFEKATTKRKFILLNRLVRAGVLLVNGIKDEFYSADDEGGPDNDLEYFYSNFRLLAKKNR